MSSQGQIKPYVEMSGIAPFMRNVTMTLDQLPYSMTLLAFKLVLALPPPLSRALVFWLTQPDYEDVARFRDVVADDFTGALMNLHGPCAINEADATIIYVHGGVGILGHAKMYSPMFRQLLQAIEGVGLGRKERRAQLLSVEYTLADSNNPPPKQQEEVAAAYRFLLAQGVPAETIVIAGDSAGALFSTRAILDYPNTHGGNMKLAGAIFFSPWLDIRHEYTDAGFTSPSASNDIVSTTFLTHGTDALSSRGQDLSSYSPNNASAEDLARLPPSIVTIGAAEKLKDSINRFCDKLKDCERIEMAGACHDWICRKTLTNPEKYAERDRDIKRIGEWVAKRVGWTEETS